MKKKEKPKVLNSFKQLWRLKQTMLPEGQQDAIQKMEQEFDQLIEGKDDRTEEEDLHSL